MSIHARLSRCANLDGTTLRQVAVLPFRRKPSSEREILVIASRETQSFIIPAGWRPRKLSAWKAAAREAEQKAGLEGRIGHKPIGKYLHWKRLEDHLALVEVTVYPLEVRKCRTDWPEKAGRACRWVSPQEAALLVDEPGLMAILEKFSKRKKNAPKGGRRTALSAIDGIGA